jgi:hypothetical protein
MKRRDLTGGMSKEVERARCGPCDRYHGGDPPAVGILWLAMRGGARQ